jgi:hypothetical protein
MIINGIIKSADLPVQKIPEKQKNLDWHIENLLYWENELYNDDSKRFNMYSNHDLYYHGIMSLNDINKITNPYKFEDVIPPKDLRNYPISYPRIQSLLGEEIQRFFTYKIFVTNRDSISKIEEDKKDIWLNTIKNIITEGITDEKVIAEKLDSIKEYLDYDYQDIKELSATELVKHFTLTLSFKRKASEMIENLILYGNGIFDVGVNNNSPYLTVEDPKNIYWIPSSVSRDIDDADVVLKEYYLPLSNIIDLYYEKLEKVDLEYLLELKENLSENRNWADYQYYTKKTDADGMKFIEPSSSLWVDDRLVAGNTFQGYINENGDVRVVELRFKSLKKVGKVTYYDEESGKEMTKWVDENYVADIYDNIEWKYINEAREITRLGESCFIEGKVRDLQFRKLDNKSYCSLGYVGSDMKTVFFDIIKDYQLLYNAYMYRTERAMIKSLGNIGTLDLAEIPDDWDVEMAMYYATELGWKVIDSFKESKKGASQGKIVGQNTGRSASMNLSQTDTINQNLQMLQYIENQMDIVCGIPPSRRGDIKSDQGLGTLEISQNKASNITESLFTIYDNIKIRAIERLLEAIKYCIRDNKNLSIQYISNELTSKVFTIDGELVNESDYGLVVADAKSDYNAIQTLKRASEIAMQTGMIGSVDLLNIFTTESTSDIRRKLQKSAKVKEQRDQERFNAEQEQAKQIEENKRQMLMLSLEDKEKDRELKRYEIDVQADTKIALAELGALGMSDADPSIIVDQADLSMKQRELTEYEYDNSENRKLKDKEIKSKSEIEKEKIRLKKEELKSKEKIEKLKSETAIKVAKSNKNKYDKK